MILAVLGLVVVVLVGAALSGLVHDPDAVRRLRRSEYRSLVLNIWWH
jgi:hypothetical protein